MTLAMRALPLLTVLHAGAVAAFKKRLLSAQAESPVAAFKA
jgi:hypothetical protein